MWPGYFFLHRFRDNQACIHPKHFSRKTCRKAYAKPLTTMLKNYETGFSIVRKAASKAAGIYLAVPHPAL